MEFFIVLSLALILCVVALLIKLNWQHIFFEHIQFCVTKNSNKLVDWINKVQSYSVKKIPPDIYFPKADLMPPVESVYRITPDERDMANEIIGMYQKQRIDGFFAENLKPSRFFCKLSHSEYFVLTLYWFLIDNEHKRIFDTDLYSYTHSDDTYRYHKLTDLGIVYYKLLLISDAYSITINTPQKDIVACHMVDQYKKILDTQTIMFYK